MAATKNKKAVTEKKAPVEGDIIDFPNCEHHYHLNKEKKLSRRIVYKEKK